MQDSVGLCQTHEILLYAFGFEINGYPHRVFVILGSQFHDFIDGWHLLPAARSVIGSRPPTMKITIVTFKQVLKYLSGYLDFVPAASLARRSSSSWIRFECSRNCSSFAASTVGGLVPLSAMSARLTPY